MAPRTCKLTLLNSQKSNERGIITHQLAKYLQNLSNLPEVTRHVNMRPGVLMYNGSLEDVMKNAHLTASILFKNLSDTSVLRLQSAIIYSVSIISFI